MRAIVFLLVAAFSLVAQAGFEEVTSLDWSPTGDLFLIASGGVLYAGQAPTAANVRPLTNPDQVFATWARFGPKGGWFVYAAPSEEGYTLWEGFLDSEKQPQELFQFDGVISQPAVSPRGNLVAFVGEKGRKTDLFLLDLDTKKLKRLTDTAFPEACPDFSPDGKFLAFSGLWGSEEDSWNLFLLNLENGSIQQLTDDHFFDWCPRFSPDGKWLAFESNQAGHSNIYVIRVDGTDLTPFTYDDWRDAFPAWSPDGEKIAYAQHKTSGWVIVVEGAY